jgi:flagellar hook-length control protein FliK
MNNLPISTSTPQSAAAAKQSANSTSSGSVQDSQPFGDVLSRQISDPKSKDTKASDKLAADVLAQLGRDSTAADKKTDAVATDGVTTLPTDMLAALLPQVMNTSNVTSANSSSTDSKSVSNANVTPSISSSTDPISVSNAIDTAADIGKPGNIAMKAKTTDKLPVSVDSKAALPVVVETPSKEAPFAAALTAPATRTSTGVELTAALRETASVAVQQPNTALQSGAAALASLQNSTASIAAPLIQPVQVTINTPVNQNKWSDEFSQKITWLASSKQDQTAELHLNPPQLGPLDVVIKVSGDQATALFTSPHASVREAVEQAMPRLREMLADNGIMLGNTTVSDQTPRDQGQSGSQRTVVPTGNDIRDTTPVTNTAARVSPITRHNGIVDTFA